MPECRWRLSKSWNPSTSNPCSANRAGPCVRPMQRICTTITVPSQGREWKRSRQPLRRPDVPVGSSIRFWSSERFDGWKAGQNPGESRFLNWVWSTSAPEDDWAGHSHYSGSISAQTFREPSCSQTPNRYLCNPTAQNQRNPYSVIYGTPRHHTWPQVFQKTSCDKRRPTRRPRTSFDRFPGSNGRC